MIQYDLSQINILAPTNFTKQVMQCVQNVSWKIQDYEIFFVIHRFLKKKRLCACILFKIIYKHL